MEQEPLIKIAGISDLFYVLNLGDWLYSVFEYIHIPQWFATLFSNLLNFGINGLIWAVYITGVVWAVSTYGIN